MLLGQTISVQVKSKKYYITTDMIQDFKHLVRGVAMFRLLFPHQKFVTLDKQRNEGFLTRAHIGVSCIGW